MRPIDLHDDGFKDFICIREFVIHFRFCPTWRKLHWMLSVFTRCLRKNASCYSGRTQTHNLLLSGADYMTKCLHASNALGILLHVAHIFCCIFYHFSSSIHVQYVYMHKSPPVSTNQRDCLLWDCIRHVVNDQSLHGLRKVNMALFQKH